jgi:transposase
MLALHPRVIDAVWRAIEPLIPRHRPRPHPLGCHRRRISNRVCFEGVLRRLVTGCSWDVAGRISGAGETTLRRRRDEWTAAGVFERVRDEALAGYDRIVGTLVQRKRRLDRSNRISPSRASCKRLSFERLNEALPTMNPSPG